MIQGQSLRLTTFVVLVGCYSLMILSILAFQNFNRFVLSWGENREVIAYLKSDVTPSEIDSLQNKLKFDLRIESVNFQSKEVVLKNYQGQLASMLPGLSEDQELMNLIPASLEVRLKDKVTTEDIARVAQFLEKESGVEEVSYGQEWLKHFEVLVKILRSSLVFMTLIVLGASLFVVSNIIRTHVYQKKEEIEILEMLGAGPTMIRLPFLKEGVWMGGLAIAVALIINGLLWMQLRDYLVMQYPLSAAVHSLRFLNVYELVVVFCMGALASLASAYFSIVQLNTGKSTLYRWADL